MAEANFMNILDRKIHDEWLAQLKPGDKVAVKGRGTPGSWGYSAPVVGIVERETKNQLIVSFVKGMSARYNRLSGRPIGGSRYPGELVPVSQSVIDQMAADHLHRRFAEIARSFGRRDGKITTSHLEAMVKAFDGVEVDQ